MEKKKNQIKQILICRSIVLTSTNTCLVQINTYFTALHVKRFLLHTLFSHTASLMFDHPPAPLLIFSQLTRDWLCAMICVFACIYCLIWTLELFIWHISKLYQSSLYAQLHLSRRQRKKSLLRKFYMSLAYHLPWPYSTSACKMMQKQIKK